MKHTFIPFLVVAVGMCGVSACVNHAQPTFEDDFRLRAQDLALTGSGEVFNRELSPEQRTCLEMLYAYMPLSDMADCTPDYFLDYVVNPALIARSEMPWGKQISDTLFRHFVLPVRVNNEALDGHRPLFYLLLKPRVAHLSMKEAILEINHWCHEHLTYEPSDGRTHSPLQSMASAIGRCGEESTFTVAALRAAGIPARQVYTPRWAHTDDNHAWVEAWADGQWYFLGACEPEPVLNLGWFNAPASRGMLMHAPVFGRYNGQEENFGYDSGITKINVTRIYAPTSVLNVQVVDKAGRPVPEADVQFCLYNYAEFYPIATRKADAQGKAQLEAGLGDLLLWASDGAQFGLQQAHVGADSLVRVVLQHDSSSAFEMDLTVVPPREGAAQVEVTAAQRAENTRRLAQEDSIRHAYAANFFRTGGSKFVAAARGNGAVIETFLDKAGARHELAENFLATLATKDLTDIPAEVLNDHFNPLGQDDAFSLQYVMCPRIAMEALTPWRSYLQEAIPQQWQEAAKTDPRQWVQWVRDSIAVVRYIEPTPMSPASVWRLRKTSARSRQIFFVASMRAMGIPARIDVTTGKTQWADANQEWVDVQFDVEQSVPEAAPKGSLAIHYTPSALVPDAKYYSHFTLSQLQKGKPKLLVFPDFASVSNLFAQPQTLDAGQYLLTTGQRMADGSVQARINVFGLASGDTTQVEMAVRSDENALQVIGTFDAESKFIRQGATAPQSILSHTGRGYFVLGLVKVGNEPSNHALRDIAAAAEQLKAAGRPILLLFPSEADIARCDKATIAQLQAVATLGIDPDGALEKAIAENLRLSAAEPPLFIISDTFNRIVYAHHGYTIQLGETLAKTLHQLAQ